MAVKPIPEDRPNVTPYLIVRGAAEAIDFYERAFGAKEVMRLPTPDGRLMHAELRLGNAMIFLADEFPEMGGGKSPVALGGTPCTIHLYVTDTDAVFARALTGGAKGTMPPADMFWGDRFAKLVDPFGHEWSLATHKEDLTPAQVAERAKTAFPAPPK